MSVSDKFENFTKELRMKSNVVTSVSNRYKLITKRLNEDFYSSESETFHSLYVGSYGRGTAIHVSDIDMLFVLPNSFYDRYNAYTNNSQSSLLQFVKNSIEKTYPKSYLGADGQVIKLDFSDGINFEIVPCFRNNDGSFKFPDSNNGGSWKSTNPNPEIYEINIMNKDCNKNLKRLCRMARAWKDNWNVPIGGLLIDTLAYNFIKDWKYKEYSFAFYDYMTRDFLKYLKDRDKNQQYWLSPGADQFVYRKGIFENKASQCYNIALDAIGYEEKNNDWSANQKWREIYGAKFKD